MTSYRGIIGLLAVLVAAGGLIYMIVTSAGAVLSPQRLVHDVFDRFDTPANSQIEVTRDFTVREGDSTSVVADRLQAAGLIENALVFRLMAEMEDATGRLTAGEYDLSPSMRPSEILEILVEGRTRPAETVTIPEGWRIEEVAERLAERGIGSADRFMELARDYRPAGGAAASRPPGASLEGYLFPNTYSFTKRTTVDDMLEQMIQEFEAQLTPEMRRKAEMLGMSTHQIVTLASIIEREAVVPAERALMAGVFYNRLEMGMMLQTDPTVQYALASADHSAREQFGWWKRDLTFSDLQLDSPYNTYRNTGLPPGPICNPGLASLLAAVEPASTDYLFFVARPDGSHAFSTTLEEHHENVLRYRSGDG
jgi:UPF0755 protein